MTSRAKVIFNSSAAQSFVNNSSVCFNSRGNPKRIEKLKWGEGYKGLVWSRKDKGTKYSEAHL